MFGICSKFTIKRPERRQRRRSGVFIVNLEHMSQIVGGVSIVNLEQVNVGWAFENIQPNIQRIYLVFLFISLYMFSDRVERLMKFIQFYTRTKSITRSNSNTLFK